MKDLLTWLSRQRFPYQPLISVEISNGRLLHNLHEFQLAAQKLKPGVSIAPVLKSNAYGHGLFEVAEILEKNQNSMKSRAWHRLKSGFKDLPSTPIEGKDLDIPFFVVDSYFEAVALRVHGIRTPLLIIGYTRPETIASSSLRDTAFTVTSLDTLRQFAEDEPDCPESPEKDVHGRYPIRRFHHAHIHLKIDTGMRRQGILPEEADEAIKIIQGNPALVLEGICTHFCDADDPDGSFTEGQINLWDRKVKKFKAAFPHLRYFHAAATDGSSLSKDIYANVVRLGIGLYGLSENPVLNQSLNLEPVLEMKTILTGVKKFKSGETVGYGNTFEADKDMTISTIPVGYFEGIDRRSSSGLSDDGANEPNGFVQVGPNRVACPIIGRVSMNITTIDVSAVPKAIAGMEAVVISHNPNDPNSIASMARNCGTISYDIVVGIPAHLKRVVVD
jgi:alanine racemase